MGRRRKRTRSSRSRKEVRDEGREKETKDRPFKPHVIETVVVGLKLVVSKSVFEGLEAVRRSGLTNMLDRPVVADLAARMGFQETTKWIMTNPSLYARGVFGGFSPEEECSQQPETGEPETGATEGSDPPKAIDILVEAVGGEWSLTGCLKELKGRGVKTDQRMAFSRGKAGCWGQGSDIISVMRMKPSEELAVERVVARLRQEFGASQVFLYGSAARGDMDEESDIDLVAVLPCRDWRVQCDVCDLCLEEDVGLGRIISCMVCTEADLKYSWPSPWMESVREEGVSL